jgi:hypothetical protein
VPGDPVAGERSLGLGLQPCAMLSRVNEGFCGEDLLESDSGGSGSVGRGSGSTAPGASGVETPLLPAHGRRGDRRNIGSGGCGRQGCRASGSLVSPGPGFSRAASCWRCSQAGPFGPATRQGAGFGGS